MLDSLLVPDASVVEDEADSVLRQELAVCDRQAREGCRQHRQTGLGDIIDVHVTGQNCVLCVVAVVVDASDLRDANERRGVIHRPVDLDQADADDVLSDLHQLQAVDRRALLDDEGAQVVVVLHGQRFDVVQRLRRQADDRVQVGRPRA